VLVSCFIVFFYFLLFFVSFFFILICDESVFVVAAFFSFLFECSFDYRPLFSVFFCGRMSHPDFLSSLFCLYPEKVNFLPVFPEPDLVKTLFTRRSYENLFVFYGSGSPLSAL